jgi:hypothetical protein
VKGKLRKGGWAGVKEVALMPRSGKDEQLSRTMQRHVLETNMRFWVIFLLERRCCSELLLVDGIGKLSIEHRAQKAQFSRRSWSGVVPLVRKAVKRTITEVEGYSHTKWRYCDRRLPALVVRELGTTARRWTQERKIERDIDVGLG